MTTFRVGAIVVLLAGCKDSGSKSPPQEPPCYGIPGEVCDETGEEGETGGDTAEETGGDSSGDNAPEVLEPGQCVFNEDPDKSGLQYNCFGEVHTSLDLTIKGLFPTCEAFFDDDDWCWDEFFFGYEGNVVACCGEYDIDLKPNYQQFCIYDLYQQLCFSIAAHLEYLVKHGDFGIFTDKGKKLAEYVAAEHHECWESFKANNIAEVPNVQTQWALKKNFGLLTDVVFHIEGNTRVDGVNAPDFQDEWPTCHGAAFNDYKLFGNSRQQIGDVIVGVDLAAAVHAELSGPVVLGGAVSATADLGPTCTAFGCPSAEFSYAQDDSIFGLEAFSLFGNSFEISNGQYTLTADRVQIELYAPAEGVAIFDDGEFRGYEIPAGEAIFLISGTSGDIFNRFMAANSSSIFIIPEEPEFWTIDAFSLEYEDNEHERWTLVLDQSHWHSS